MAGFRPGVSTVHLQRRYRSRFTRDSLFSPIGLTPLEALQTFIYDAETNDKCLCRCIGFINTTIGDEEERVKRRRSPVLVAPIQTQI